MSKKKNQDASVEAESTVESVADADITVEIDPKAEARTKLAALENAASFGVLVKAGESATERLVSAYDQVVRAINELEQLANQQAHASDAAREFAKSNGLETNARRLGRAPLLAHAVEALSAATRPVISRADPYLRQFANMTERMQFIQKTLNEGAIMVVPGMTDLEVTAAMLRGETPVKPESDHVAKLNADAKGWWGFRGDNRPKSPDYTP